MPMGYSAPPPSREGRLSKHPVRGGGERERERDGRERRRARERAPSRSYADVLANLLMMHATTTLKVLHAHSVRHDQSREKSVTTLSCSPLPPNQRKEKRGIGVYSNTEREREREREMGGQHTLVAVC